jgi:preprotein translocase subunit SecG
MVLLAAVDWLHYLFMIPLALLSVFLVLVILVQRGRGGGLTGALGGMGGQSAFGTKAGDLFTRITIIVAAIWVLLSMASLKILNQRSATAGLNPNARSRATAPVIPGAPGTGTALPPITGDGKAGPTTTDGSATTDPGAMPKGGETSAPPAAAPKADATPAPAPATPPADVGTKPAEPAQP